MANTAAVLAKHLLSFSLSEQSRSVPDLAQGFAAFPRGGITEILGKTSAGRTAVAQAASATATRGGEVCAWIDGCDSFDPASALVAGTDLGKLLWVQCSHRIEVALKATDMICHNGGFGLIVLDLCGASTRDLQRIPTSFWYRIRRAIENTPSVLMVLGNESIAKSCSVRQFSLESIRLEWRGRAPFQTLTRLETRALSQKPMSGAASTIEMIASSQAAV